MDRTMRCTVCTCKQEDAARKKAGGVKKVHEKGRELPHTRVLAVVCHMAPLFLTIPVRLSSHTTKVATRVCVHVYVYSCTRGSRSYWLPRK